MNDLITTVLSMSQQGYQQQLSMSLLKAKAESDQAMADMLAENAKRLAAMTSSASARGGIDIYV